MGRYRLSLTSFGGITIATILLGMVACMKKESPGSTEEKVEVAPFEPQLVGTRYFDWVDSSRTDPQYGSLRAIDVQVWYPTDSTGTKAPYFRNFERGSELLNWSARDKLIAERARTDSWLDAPLAHPGTAWPLLIFSPGLGSRTSFSTMYAEHFVRQGYIVVGVNHKHESGYVISGDSVVAAHHAFHDSLKTLRIPEEISAENYRMTKGLRTMVLAEDLKFCLDKMRDINDDEFGGVIDFTQIGAWGHSIGGAAVIDAAKIDSRIKAVVNFDGTPSGIALDQGMRQPFMFIEDMTDLSMKGYEIQYQRRTIFCESVESVAYRVLLDDTNHQSFYDMNVHSASSAKNRDKALSILQIAMSYMDTFFDRHVRESVVSIAPIKFDSLEVLVIP